MDAFSLKVLMSGNHTHKKKKKSSAAGDSWWAAGKTVCLVMKTGKIQGNWKPGLVHIVWMKLEAYVCSQNKRNNRQSIQNSWTGHVGILGSFSPAVWLVRHTHHCASRANIRSVWGVAFRELLFPDSLNILKRPTRHFQFQSPPVVKYHESGSWPFDRNNTPCLGENFSRISYPVVPFV